MIYALLPQGYVEKVANAVRRAHYGFAPHAGVEWDRLADGEKARWIDEAKTIIDHACGEHVVSIRQHATAKGEVLTPEEEARRVLKLVDAFVVMNFGVSVNAS